MLIVGLFWLALSAIVYLYFTPLPPPTAKQIKNRLKRFNFTLGHYIKEGKRSNYMHKKVDLRFIKWGKKWKNRARPSST